MSVVHAVVRVVHCTVYTDHLNYIGARYRSRQHALDIPHLVLLKPKKPPRLPLNIDIWTDVRRTPRNDDIDRNNKLKNRTIIIGKEQTVVHHSNRHVALTSINNECVQNETSYETTNYIIFCLCATSLLLNTLNMSRINLSGYVGHVTIFIRMFTITCCLVVGLRLKLGLGLDLVSGWQFCMHPYLCDFRMQLWRTDHIRCLSANPEAGAWRWRMRDVVDSSMLL